MEPSMVTITEAARPLSVSRALAYQEAQQSGHVAPGARAVRIGRRWVVPMCDIEANCRRPTAA
jgi:hypothetical protein